MARKTEKIKFADAAILALNADKIARKQIRKRQKILLIELFVDFAKNTTLHGLKYVNERGISIIEKIFWLITFLVSVGLCGYLIGNVWTKWQTSPVIVTFSEQMVPVGKVPFPSVTICPQMKTRKTEYDYGANQKNYEEWRMMKNLSEKNRSLAEQFQTVALVCHADTMLFSYNNFNATGTKYHDHRAVQVLQNVAYPQRNILCKWRGEDCKHFIKKVLTDEGVCYNFNSLSAAEIFNMEQIQTDYAYVDGDQRSEDWDVEKGYLNISNTDPYPKRGRANEVTPDLDIMLIESVDDKDIVCNSLNRGFKIYIQQPTDKPESSVYYYAALPGQVSSIALKFTMMTTAAGLTSYSPEMRKCYFPSDRTLYYFKLYTQNNCRLECRSNYIFRQCGCVWYNLPHNNSQRICTIRERPCVMKAYDELSDREMEAALGSRSLACHCLPACNSVMYEAEILKTDFDFQNLIARMNNQASFKNNNYSRIQIYFKEPQFMSMHRSELFGVTDFLANCGGLLGLFLGFSFLSLVEIFYFITLRFCCILKRDMQNDPPLPVVATISE